MSIEETMGAIVAWQRATFGPADPAGVALKVQAEAREFAAEVVACAAAADPPDVRVRVTEDGVQGPWRYLLGALGSDGVGEVLRVMRELRGAGLKTDGGAGWVGDGTDEPAWRLLELVTGSRTVDEGRPDAVRVEVLVGGALVLDASAEVEWGEEEPDGDAAPSLSPVECWGDGPVLQRGLEALRAGRAFGLTPEQERAAEEAADVVFLLLDGLRAINVEPWALEVALARKLAKNKARTWAQGADGQWSHVRAGEG